MAAGGTGLKESGVQEKSGAQLEKENDVVEKTATDTDMDELQTLLEEAWNAEGIEGSPEEIRQFWEGMLERRERGEVSVWSVRRVEKRSERDVLNVQR